MKPPLVYIIILNWNGCRDTIECLESVFKLDYDNFKVIVVDNGSIDDSVSIIRKTYPQVILLEKEENLGYVGGNNVAIRYAIKEGADYVWLLNNDTVVEADTLNKIVRLSERSDSIGIVSPVIHYYHKPWEAQSYGGYFDFKNFTLIPIQNKNFWLSDRARINVSIWGTAMLIKRSVIEKVGLLNKKYFAYAEDEEYSLRVNRVGYRNLVDIESKVFHKESGSTGGNKFSSMKIFLMVRNYYFLWMESIGIFEKCAFFPRYLSHVLSMMISLRNNHKEELSDALYAGVWAGIIGRGGPCDGNIRMPRALAKILKILCSWHPYFWINLFNFDVGKIWYEVFHRIGMSNRPTWQR